MNINIKLEFNDEVLWKYDDSLQTSMFGIAINYGDQFYPHEGWTDFGCALLRGWTEKLIKLLHGGQEDTLYFMDGPHSVKIRYDSYNGIIELEPDGLDSVWRVPFVTFAKAMIEAAKITLRELDRVGIAQSGSGGRDRKALEAGTKKLEAIIQKLPDQQSHLTES